MSKCTKVTLKIKFYPEIPWKCTNFGQKVQGVILYYDYEINFKNVNSLVLEKNKTYKAQTLPNCSIMKYYKFPKFEGHTTHIFPERANLRFQI